jgi:hypothetical protein
MSSASSGIAAIRDSRVERQGRRQGIGYFPASLGLQVLDLFGEEAVLGFLDGATENQAAFFFGKLQSEEFLGFCK